MENVEEYKTIKGESKQAISGPLFWILTVMYTIAYNSDFRATSIVWYGFSVITIGVLAYIVSAKYMNKSVGVYAVWAVAFFCYSFISGLWAQNVNAVLDTSKTLFLIFVVNVLLSFIIETKEDIKNLLLANFLALIFYLVYILLKVDISQLGEDRLGVGLLGSLWNANDVGMKLCVGFGLALYFGFERKDLFEKVLLFILSLVFAIVSFLSGSRTAFLLLILIAMGMFLLTAKNKMLAIGVVAVFIAGMYLLVMNVESLYEVLGKRLESLIENLFEDDASEGSFDARAEMIRFGWNAFLERPIFGYGMSNFSVLYEQATGRATYSHNNFIEILVNGGLVGFILYYFIYGYIFVKLFKPAFFKRDKIAIFLLVSNIALVAMHISDITYYQTLFNCILMIAVMYIKIGEKNENS